MYKTEVSSVDDGIKEYICMTLNEFKDRYRNHQKSFNNAKYERETSLSKYGTLRESNDDSGLSGRF